MKPLLLITGISGRIGSAAATCFCDQYQVVGLDIIDPKIEGVDYIETDLSSREKVAKALKQVAEKYGVHIAAVLHLAAYYNFAGGHWDKYEQITIGGTKNLIDALKDFTVDQFVFSSTLLVYAPVKIGEKITEESPLEASWEYPASKIETEKLLKGAPFPTAILRIAGVYDDGCHSIPISQHITRIYEKQMESHLFPGNPKAGAPYLHMEDLIDAIALVMAKGSEEIFLLGEEEVLSFASLQEELGRLIYGKPWWTIRIPKWVAKFGARLQNLLPWGKKSFIKPWMIDLADVHYAVNIEKAKKTLQWEPKHTLRKTLPLMIAALKADPKTWLEAHRV